jgi:hypothetical protein
MELPTLVAVVVVAAAPLQSLLMQGQTAGLALSSFPMLARNAALAEQ